MLVRRIMNTPRMITFCPLFFILVLLHVLRLAEVANGFVSLSPFCEKAISNASTCPDVSTFDIVDTAAYAGLWYEIGSTAQFKLLSEAGLDCLQANYTVQLSSNSSIGASLTVLNSGMRTLDPVAALGITSISSGSREVCMSARDVCSCLGPPSNLMQSVTELNKVSFMVKKQLPDQATLLDEVAQKIEGYAYNISKEFSILAEHVQTIQRFDGYLSEGNGTATANVEQMKLAMIAISKNVDVFVEFVNEIATARSLLAQVVVKLVLAGEFVNSVDVTEASALVGAAEQSIALHAERMKSSLAAMNAASEVLLADTGRPYQNVSWSIPGVATQNATAKGRLEFSVLGLDAPYWIIALEGLPSKGYDAALVYSCTENHLLETIQQGFFVLSRQPTILPATLNRFLDVASSFGIDLDCENPFLTSGCNCSPARPDTRINVTLPVHSPKLELPELRAP